MEQKIGHNQNIRWKEDNMREESVQKEARRDSKTEGQKKRRSKGQTSKRDETQPKKSKDKRKVTEQE